METAENGPKLDQNMALANSVKGIAKSVKTNSPYPTPTPEPKVETDVITILCTKAVREAEGLRITDAAKTRYIADLEDLVKMQKEVLIGQNDISNDRKLLITDLKAIKEKDDKIIADKDAQLAVKDKEIAILKKNQCGFLCKGKYFALGFLAGKLIPF